MTKPPSSMRLWAMNCRRNSAIAGPGPRRPSPRPPGSGAGPRAASSASRSCSCKRNSTRLRADLTGSSSWKPSRLAHAGQRPARRTAGRRASPARLEANCSGRPNGIAAARVDRAAEGDQRVDALARGGRPPPGRRTSRPASSRRGGRPARSARGPGRRRRRPPARGRRACAPARRARARGRRSRRPTGRSPRACSSATALVLGETS